jgi:negative regulator of sigma E activity
MPANGERVDELLSGYLDGCLSDAELAELQGALQDSAVAARLAEFQALRSDMRRLRDNRRSSAPALPDTFASSVWERIQAQQVERAGSGSSGVASRPVEGGHNTDSASRTNRSRIRSVSLVVAATAGLLLLAVLVQRLSIPGAAPLANNGTATSMERGAEADGSGNVGGQNGPRESELAESAPRLAAEEGQLPGDSGLAGMEELLNAFGGLSESAERADPGVFTQQQQWESQLMFTLVVDMRLSKQAVGDGYLEAAFAGRGIPLDLPVIADAEALAALSEARMTEQPGDGESGQDEAMLYFVHADMLVIDQLVQGFVDDMKNVPVLRMDIAFDTPVNNLMKLIAGKVGGNLEITETFAARIGQSGGETLISGIGPQGKLVASGSRGKGEAKSGNALSVLGSKSTVLLVVRHPK